MIRYGKFFRNNKEKKTERLHREFKFKVSFLFFIRVLNLQFLLYSSCFSFLGNQTCILTRFSGNKVSSVLKLSESYKP